MEICHALKVVKIYNVQGGIVQWVIHAVTDPFAAKKSSGLKDAKRRKKDKWRERPYQSLVGLGLVK